jgi:antitoxin component YwqK of YwqJK toxin-antitoxin module
MKTLSIVTLLFFSLNMNAQELLSMEDAESRESLSMNEVTANSSDGTYRYYAKGAKEPFTGILFSKFSNGQYDSYQQFVNGVGQGQWINYYENGNYKEIGTYEQNKVTGPIKKFHDNGELAAEGNYKDWRIRVGNWNFYNLEGKLIESTDYGEKGSIVEVQEYFDRGDIPYSWYSRIFSQNGF